MIIRGFITILNRQPRGKCSWAEYLKVDNMFFAKKRLVKMLKQLGGSCAQKLSI